MQTTEIRVQRVSVVSNKPFNEIIQKLTAKIGHPDMRAFHYAIIAATELVEMEKFVQNVVGPSNLIEFARYDAGEVLRKGLGGISPKIIRLVIGNPVIMKEMAKYVPDAAAYAPVTILIDERADGVHLSYDLMESLLTTYGSEAALMVASDLDEKIKQLLEAVI